MEPPAPSHKTQLALVQLLTDYTVREIETLFVGNGLKATAEVSEREWPIGESVRRHTAASYLSAVDFTDQRQRASVLRVFDDVMQALPEYYEDQGEHLARLLNQDGVGFEAPLTIRADQLRLPEDRRGRLEEALPDFAAITDTGELRRHAERIQGASLRADPPDAILAGRELLETACKLVCEAHGVDIPKSPSLGSLFKLAAKPLGLTAADHLGDDPASAASRKVLTGLASVADGLGELRTRVGRGHGRTAASPARQRHAELATGAAATLTIFLLDTWADRRAAAGGLGSEIGGAKGDPTPGS